MCVFEVLTHQWFVNTAKLLEVLKVSISLVIMNQKNRIDPVFSQIFIARE